MLQRVSGSNSKCVTKTYKTVDNGKSFVKLGGTDLYQRSFDEHKILELRDGRLAMFVRAKYGIGVSYSSDGGENWTEGEDPFGEKDRL